jgi:hypothetical protein
MIEGYLYVPVKIDLLYINPGNDYLAEYPDGILHDLDTYTLTLVEGEGLSFKCPEWQFTFNDDDIPSLYAHSAPTSDRNLTRLK